MLSLICKYFSVWCVLFFLVFASLLRLMSTNFMVPIVMSTVCVQLIFNAHFLLYLIPVGYLRHCLHDKEKISVFKNLALLFFLISRLCILSWACVFLNNYFLSLIKIDDIVPSIIIMYILLTSKPKKFALTWIVKCVKLKHNVNMFWVLK